MAENKECPLKFHTDALSVSTYPCTKEKCEWWIDDPIVGKPMCSVPAILFMLHYLTRGIQAIVEKP